MVVIALQCLWVAGCDDVLVNGSGKSVTEERQVPPFHALEAGGSLDVQITVGPEQRLAITGDENIVPVITTEVRDGRLVFGASRPYRTRTPLRIVVTMPALTNLRAGGSADIAIHDVRGESLRIQADGSADVQAAGTVDRLELHASGSADLELAELAARIVDVEASGSSDLHVQALEAIRGKLSGSADLTYRGSASVTVDTSGSADVIRE